ncbi:replication-associated protein [Crucivirus-190]|nr:replication-associated protein [Crucivirus-190]
MSISKQDFIKGEGEEDNGKKFRDFVFTYNNYNDEVETRIKAFGEQYARYIVYGREIAPTTGTKHLQGYIYLKSSNTRKSLIKHIGKCYIAPRSRRATFEQAITYCKEDGDFYEFGKAPITKHATISTRWIILKEEMKKGTPIEELMASNLDLFIKYPSGCKNAYNILRPKVNFDLLKEYPTLRPFQKDIIDYVQTQPEKRKILWICDNGRSGKSELVAHLLTHYKFIYLENAKTQDIAHAWNGEHVLFDLPRVSEEHLNYSALESLKNGRIFSSKFDSQSKCYNRPHIIIFANYTPNISSLTMDKWDIRFIDEKFNMQCIDAQKIKDEELTIEKLEDIYNVKKTVKPKNKKVKKISDYIDNGILQENENSIILNFD